MKWWAGILFILLLAMPVLALEGEIKTYVNDYAEILDAAQEQEISSKLAALQQQGLAEVAIVTIPSLEGRDIDGYALELAQGNLGDSEKNNGLLLLIAVEDRKYRFEVGRGLEPIFNDAKIGRIGRTYLVPAFKEEKYGEGIIAATQAIEQELHDPTALEQSEPISPIKALAFVFITLSIFASVFGFIARKVSRRWQNNDYFVAALAAASMFNRRGGSGGFGGFGGGGFGGGGAGGGW